MKIYTITKAYKPSYFEDKSRVEIIFTKEEYAKRKIKTLIDFEVEMQLMGGFIERDENGDIFFPYDEDNRCSCEISDTALFIDFGNGRIDEIYLEETEMEEQPPTTIHVKSINADIYLDKWNVYADKIRLYDSNKEYLGYYEPEVVVLDAREQRITTQQYLDNEAERFANMVNLNELLNNVGIYSYTIARTDDLSPIIDDFAGSCDEDNPLIEMSREEQIAWLKTNEAINFIGDYIIHNTETELYGEQNRRKIDFNAGYYGWNVYIDGEVAYSFDDFSENIKEDTTAKELAELLIDEMKYDNVKKWRLSTQEERKLKRIMIERLSNHYGLDKENRL